MRQTLINVIHLLASISVYALLLFMPLGCIASLVLSFIYTRSPNYCQDCNTGLGIVICGFFISGIVCSGIALKLGLPFGRRNRESAAQ